MDLLLILVELLNINEMTKSKLVRKQRGVCHSRLFNRCNDGNINMYANRSCHVFVCFPNHFLLWCSGFKVYQEQLCIKVICTACISALPFVFPLSLMVLSSSTSECNIPHWGSVWVFHHDIGKPLPVIFGNLLLSLILWL